MPSVQVRGLRDDQLLLLHLRPAVLPVLHPAAAHTLRYACALCAAHAKPDSAAVCDRLGRASDRASHHSDVLAAAVVAVLALRAPLKPLATALAAFEVSAVRDFLYPQRKRANAALLRMCLPALFYLTTQLRLLVCFLPLLSPLHLDADSKPTIIPAAATATTNTTNTTTNKTESVPISAKADQVSADGEIGLEVDFDMSLEELPEARRIRPVDDTSGTLPFNQQALQSYILHCAKNHEGGAMRDKPGKSRDFYHSCSALSARPFAFAAGRGDHQHRALHVGQD